MSEKMFNTRIQHKHDIEANWKKATGFIPKEGELVIYDADENCSYTRTKIGDGVTNVNDLAFVKASGYVAQEEAPYDTSVFWLDIDDTASDSSEAVLYIEQKLTEEQKTQARENIGAITMEDVFNAFSMGEGVKY